MLALLLVGETPTAGINKSAFHNAVTVIQGYEKRTGEEDRIRVVGPYFSGSAVSLRLALVDTWNRLKGQRKEPRIKVVCGSASGFSHEEFVGRDLNGLWCIDAKPGEEPAFETTVLPSDLVLYWMRKYLGNPTDPAQGESPRPIVVLQEANTSFGQYARDKMATEQQTRGSPPRPDLFEVPFPLHISHLRASYMKEQLARLESQGLPHSGRNLPFPAEGDGREGGREAVRAQAPLMTTAINDLILDNLVTTFAQKQARYACLVSTDPQDTIFLARLIRDRYPDVQLLAVGSDLLFTHDDYNYATRGMVVGSTYPLHPPLSGGATAWGSRPAPAFSSPRTAARATTTPPWSTSAGRTPGRPTSCAGACSITAGRGRTATARCLHCG
jgi:hypothetical protein